MKGAIGYQYRYFFKTTQEGISYLCPNQLVGIYSILYITWHLIWPRCVGNDDLAPGKEKILFMRYNISNRRLRQMCWHQICFSFKLLSYSLPLIHILTCHSRENTGIANDTKNSRVPGSLDSASLIQQRFLYRVFVSNHLVNHMSHFFSSKNLLNIQTATYIYNWEFASETTVLAAGHRSCWGVLC